MFKKSVSVLLAIILAFSIVTVVPVSAQETDKVETGAEVEVAQTGKSADEAIAWVQSQVGQSIDMDGDPWWQPYQCVDLIKAYYQFLGVSPVSGDGFDYTWNDLPTGWNRYEGVQPQKGDILVYHKSEGNGYHGHVAIYESDYVTYHQNFDGCNYVVRATYRYNGINDPYWGVVRPNFNNINFTPVDMGADFYGAIESISLNKPVKTSGVELTRGNRDGSDEQRWHFQRQGDLSYKIINIATGNCLDVWNGETVNGTKVWTFSSNDSTAQRWYFRYNGNGLSLVPKCAPRMALDLYAFGGSNIGLYEYNEGNGNQIFGIDYQPSFSPRNLGEKFYANIIFSKFGSAVGVNLSNRNVEPMKYTGENNQLWLFERYDDRMYKITNVANGQCLDVWDGRTDDNTNLWTFPSNNALAQRWYFKANASGYSLVPKLAMNKSMDCVWNSNSNTTNCAIWASGDGNKNQIFTINYKLSPDATATFNGKTYELYNKTLAWNHAYKFCEQQGGHLVTITSQEEQSFIEELLTSSTNARIWAGGTDVYQNKTWNWVTRERFDYTNWSESHSDSDTKYHLVLNKNTGKWDDTTSDTSINTYSAYSFICEYEIKDDVSSYTPEKSFDYNDHTYEIYTNVTDWQTAKRICQAKGGHLVTISSATENNMIFNNIKNLTNERYWIGASDLQQEGNWVWISGETINYTNWNSSEPSNSDGVEDYAEINASTGKWNDLRGYGCTHRSVGFICEYDEIKPDFILGDADGDGRVTANDATWIQRFILQMGVSSSFNESAADVNNDGKITIVDATWIQRWLVGTTIPHPIGKPV